MKDFVCTLPNTTPKWDNLDSRSKPANSFNWSYLFKNGTSLVGKVEGILDQDRKTILDPKNITAAYIASDGKTVLQSWQGNDFLCFEPTLDGENIVIVASNDNLQGNSMCLVSSMTRSRAQVTDGEFQLVGEVFNNAAWSITPKTSSVAISELDWSLSPFFPFVSFTFNLQLPSSQKLYKWHFSPFFPFYPSLEIVISPTS